MEEETEVVVPSKRFSLADLTTVVVQYLAQTSEATTTALHATHWLLAGHYNYQADKTLFEQEAREAIENLTNGEPK